jgi:hypothetical protein
MIKKSIVKQTIEVLEDTIDYLDLGDNDSETLQRKAEVQSLLNFWRLYLNFLPEEDDAC